MCGRGGSGLHRRLIMKKILFVSAIALAVGFGVITISAGLRNNWAVASLAPCPTQENSDAVVADAESSELNIDGATIIHLEGIDGGAGMDIIYW